MKPQNQTAAAYRLTDTERLGYTVTPARQTITTKSDLMTRLKAIVIMAVLAVPLLASYLNGGLFLTELLLSTAIVGFLVTAKAAASRSAFVSQ